LLTRAKEEEFDHDVLKFFDHAERKDKEYSFHCNLDRHTIQGDVTWQQCVA
jgi:hypothetical protein